MSNPTAPQLWQTANHPRLTGLQQDWLLDEGSLTQRLIKLSKSCFKVDLLHQGWDALRTDECQALGIQNQASGWIREVFLCGQGQPWVFARSVASHESLITTNMDLASLGCRPLGELLFQTQGFQRGPLELCHYPKSWLPESVQTQGLWARRSCFTQGSLKILVAEIFLPAFWYQLTS
ncbi:chorismate lyase [Azomonas agilis]|uniref:Probable chorismate pyruvate-lyase n=1 Tax=Azomonas agilis TaxID=116849 RepID=A0A562J0D7_9GAMM|nr:chorismate lyase [Azomonas agilis]TWH76255.1 chorismate lyase [Azomonas agilis]